MIFNHYNYIFKTKNPIKYYPRIKTIKLFHFDEFAKSFILVCRDRNGISQKGQHLSFQMRVVVTFIAMNHKHKHSDEFHHISISDNIY